MLMDIDIAMHIQSMVVWWILETFTDIFMIFKHALVSERCG